MEVESKVPHGSHMYMCNGPVMACSSSQWCLSPTMIQTILF